MTKIFKFTRKDHHFFDKETEAQFPDDGITTTVMKKAEDIKIIYSVNEEIRGNDYFQIKISRQKLQICL